ncbi:hypothetical protein RchiOBHm_Chr7g0221881 [Rosa chinensis]|uniref:Uncharacterized protein n=1 Tax=Rosa chinensis TaxID=74649 RepID=A0A2P6PD49_ROSCH|nr:hypothetical protein RchiOBHm_Chr7g0221881 [Rosa chinensis]
MHDFSLFQILLLLFAFNLHMLMLSYKCMKLKSLAFRLVVMYAIFAFQLLYFSESIITRLNIIVYAIGSSPIDVNALEKKPLSILPYPDPR